MYHLFFVLLTFISILFAGCAENQPLEDTESMDNPQAVDVQVVVGSWLADDESVSLASGCEVGFFAENSPESGYYAQNLKYVASSGQVVAESQSVKYPQGNDAAIIYAYSPYTSSSNISNSSINASVSTDQNTYGTAASDWLWGSVSAVKQGRNQLDMCHAMSLVRVNLTSESGGDFSTARVELLNQFTGAVMSVRDGTLRGTFSDQSAIRAKQVTTNSYEAIILPLGLTSTTEFIRVHVGGKDYTYTIPAQMFEAGKTYTFDITVKDEAVPLECDIDVKYDGQILGSTLTVPAVVPDKILEILTSYSKYIWFKVRNQSGGYSWAHIYNALTSGDKTQMVQRERMCYFRFDENLGEQRTLILEFYDKEKPQAVYKQIAITQQAASDYMNISTLTANFDRYGTVYDIPYELDVKSNKEWSIQTTADWIRPNYNTGLKNQLVTFDVEINNTGASRSATIQFMVGGSVYRSVQVAQSTAENATFTLKYEINYDLTTVDNHFNYRNMYPDDAHVYNYYTSEFGDATATILSNEKYGFLVDAPSSFNKISVRGFRHNKFFTCRKYSGKATTLYALNFAVRNKTVWYPYFRAFKIDLPVPAGVKRNQMVVYFLDIYDTEKMLVYPKPTITTQIIDQ